MAQIMDSPKDESFFGSWIHFFYQKHEKDVVNDRQYFIRNKRSLTQKAN